MRYHTFRTVARKLSLSMAVAMGLLVTADTGPAQTRAGQVICFSFDGAGALSGKDSSGSPSRTGVRVGGQSFFVGGAGQSPEDCANALVSQLTAAGYTATKSAANVVCVTHGKNGAAIETGGIIGTTDTGLEGIDCSVEKPQPMPFQAPPKKTLKTQGIQLPMPKPNMAVTINQTLTIQVDVERMVNGSPVLVQVQIRVPLTAGMTSQQVARAIEDALRRAGLNVSRVVHQSPVLNAPIPSFAIDFDVDGNPVRHIVFWQPLQQDLFPIEVAAGDTPLFGGTTYGQGSGQLPPRMFQGILGFPSVGGVYDPFLQNGFPGGIGIPAIGFGQFQMPLLGGDLLIDPTILLLFPPMPLDPHGNAALHLPIPPQPALAGLDLHSQWLVMDPRANQLGLSNGLTTTIGR